MRVWGFRQDTPSNLQYRQLPIPHTEKNFILSHGNIRSIYFPISAPTAIRNLKPELICRLDHAGEWIKQELVWRGASYNLLRTTPSRTQEAGCEEFLSGSPEHNPASRAANSRLLLISPNFSLTKKLYLENFNAYVSFQ